MRKMPKPSSSQFYGHQSFPLIPNLNISWLLSVHCWVQSADESPSIFASPVLRGRGTHTLREVWRHSQTCPCSQQCDGIFGRCWTRQFQREVATCPLKQRNRTNWASALPNLPFSWDSSYVLGFNVSQGLCQQRLVHQNSQGAREISRSYSFISKAQAVVLQFFLFLDTSASYHNSL